MIALYPLISYCQPPLLRDDFDAYATAYAAIIFVAFLEFPGRICSRTPETVMEIAALLSPSPIFFDLFRISAEVLRTRQARFPLTIFSH